MRYVYDVTAIIRHSRQTSCYCLSSEIVFGTKETNTMGFLDVLSSTFSSSTTIYLGLAAIVLFFIYDYWTHTYFRRMGIPGPPPKPIFGNASDFFGVPMYEVLAEYSKKYGPIVGVYLWRRPCLMVSDPEVLRHIMIKDHHKFYNRLPIPVSSGVFDNALFALKDSQWKRVRDIMTPTFSGKKMKMMSDIINGCADDMVENLQKSCEKDGTIESLNLFGSFVVDTIASCGFGLKVNSQKDKDDPFVKNVAKFFKVSFTTPAFVVVAFLPWMRHVLQVLKVTLFPKDVINFFAEVTEKAIALRENHSSKEVKADFLQLLLDANSDQNQTANENDDDDVHNKYFTDAGASEEVQTKSRKYMTREELLAQSMIFLAAGYETTSTLLTLTSYLLATNPDQQEKLIAEIDDLAPKRRDVSYTTVSKMPYLDQVVCEVLRIYPPATLFDRECDETCQYGGFTFQKGLQVWIPSYTLHHDPQYWPNPTKFDPDRFTKENREGRHPFTWLPFGAGPRICIGMRFALMEAKMALVRALQVVRFEVSPQTKIPPELGKAGLLSPPNGITLKVTSR